MNSSGVQQLPARWVQFIHSEMAQEPWYHFYIRTAVQLLDLLGEPVAGLRIADVGCTPAVSVLLAMLGAEVTLIDIAHEELVKGTSYARRLDVEDRIRLVQADLFALPFSGGTFDLVWNSGVIEHFPDPASVVRHMAAIARPQGRIAVLVPHLWTPHSLIWRPLARTVRRFHWDYMGRERSFTSNRLRATVRQAGLTVEKVRVANLRRSLLDDFAVGLLQLDSAPLQPLLWQAMAACDWLEDHVPVSAQLGFMVGAVARRTG